MKFELSVLAFVATVANAQGAPDFDMACANWGLLYTKSEFADACWPQIDAMDAYCKENKEDAACLEYEMALFGEDAFGEALVMRKNMLATKKALIKRTGAPTVDEKCYDLGLYTSSSDESKKCKEQVFAMDNYCMWVADSDDAACKKYEATPFTNLGMRKSMLAAQKSLIKRTGAPTVDDKCWELLKEGWNEVTEKCWDSFDAMDNFCWVEDNGANEDTEACSTYEDNLFGSAVVMQKPMTALKAKMSLTKKRQATLAKIVKRTGAPTVDDKCFDLLWGGSDVPQKCWDSFDAMDNFCWEEEYGLEDAKACRTYMDNLYGSAVVMQKPMTALKAKMSLTKKRQATLAKIVKRTGAPTVDDKCWEILWDEGDEADKCWDSFVPMEDFCRQDDNKEDEACRTYSENFYGALFGSSVVMQKPMTAFKAMRNQVSLMGKAETTSDSSSFSEVAVGAAVGMVVGAAGAIIAARSCTLKTDDAFSRV